MPLGIDGEPKARFGKRAFFADAGEHVGERPALRRVIGNVIDGDERRTEPLAEFGQQAEPARLVAAMIMHAGEERAARRRADQSGEAFGESVISALPRKRESRRSRFAGRANTVGGGNAMNIWPSLAPRISSKVRWHSPFLALRLPVGEEPAEPAIGLAIGRIGQHLETVDGHEPRADEKLDVFCFSLRHRRAPRRQSCCGRRCRWRQGRDHRQSRPFPADAMRRAGRKNWWSRQVRHRRSSILHSRKQAMHEPARRAVSRP